MTHTCYNCERPTEGDYRIIAFDIGPDGIPVNLAFCADCRARGVVLGTRPAAATRPADLEKPEDDLERFAARLLARRPERVGLVVWLKLITYFAKNLRDKKVVWYQDRDRSGWTCGVVIDDSTPPDLWGAP